MFHCVTSYNASRLWTDACRCYMAMVRSLFLSYMDKTDLHRLVCELITKDATEGQHKLENNEDNCTMKSDDADDSCEEIPNKLSRVEINDKIERITLIVSWLADRRLIIWTWCCCCALICSFFRSLIPLDFLQVKKQNLTSDDNNNSDNNNNNSDDNSSLELKRALNDITVLLRWREVDSTFVEHLKRLSSVSQWNQTVETNLEIFPWHYIDKQLAETFKNFVRNNPKWPELDAAAADTCCADDILCNIFLIFPPSKAHERNSKILSIYL